MSLLFFNFFDILIPKIQGGPATMFTHFTTLLGGLHGTSSFRIVRWLFRDNPTVGIIVLAGIILYAIYRYMNRH